MGEKVYDFDPKRDYYYKPLSQSIETEQSKGAKVRLWTQILGYITQLQHPDTPKLVNYILSQIFKYTGDEFVNFGKTLLNPNVPITGGPSETPALAGTPTSNQAGIPQSLTEQTMRGATGGA